MINIGRRKKLGSYLDPDLLVNMDNDIGVGRWILALRPLLSCHEYPDLAGIPWVSLHCLCKRGDPPKQFKECWVITGKEDGKLQESCCLGDPTTG